jgi:CPA1 family monovalent cation:H+ antiporter
MLGVWTTMIFVMNAFVFIIIGLQLPDIIAGLGGYSIAEAVKYALIISGIIIALRILWVYPAAFVPRWLSARARRDPSPGWKGPLIIGWAGMRGVVSLATALSIPLLTTYGTDFPHRNLIVFITFVVILITLVVQGLTLPLIIKLIKLEEIDHVVREDEQQAGIQLRLDTIALDHVHKKHTGELADNELLLFYKENIKLRMENTQMQLNSSECSQMKATEVKKYQKVLMEVYALQRKELFKLRKEKFFSDEEIRKAELQVDLNELKIHNSKHL